MPPPEPSTPPVTEPPLGAQPASASSAVDYPPAARAQSLFRQRPELLVAATFVGGLLAATILKRLAR